MLRTGITQKQYQISKNSSIEPTSVIKTMIKIIKSKSKDSMDAETRVQFSKIADAVLRMVEEI